MRIVNFEEFCALSEGVIYSNYRSAEAHGLLVRGLVFDYGGDTPRGYFYKHLIAKPEQFGAEWLEMNTTWEPWRMVNYDQQYAIYEDADLRTILMSLVEGLGKGEIN